MAGGFASAEEEMRDDALHGKTPTDRWYALQTLDPVGSRTVFEKVASDTKEEPQLRRLAITRLDPYQSIVALRCLRRHDKSPDIRTAAIRQLQKS